MKISKLVIVIFFFSCFKEPVIKDTVREYVYKQTYCADPWGYGSTDSLTGVRLLHYLDSAQLTVPLMGVLVKRVIQTGVSCQACHCISGKEIYLTGMYQTNSTQEKALFNLGFSLLK